MSTATVSKTKTKSTPRTKRQNLLAADLATLVRLRADIAEKSLLEKDLTNKFRKLLTEGVSVETSTHFLELGAEETPTQNYDIAKAFNLLTKAQMVAVCTVSGPKLRTLAASGEIKPNTEVSLRVGTPTVKARKVLIKNQP